MKEVLTIALVLLLGGENSITRISKANKAKEEAMEAYISGDFATSIQKYHLLLDTLGYNDAHARLNLAHAYFNTKDTVSSPVLYQNILNHTADPKIQSIAAQQLGILDMNAKRPEQALSYFKQSLRTNPYNQEARYNYELVKKILNKKNKQEQKEQQPQPKNDDPQNEEKGDEDSKNSDSENQENKENQENPSGKNKNNPDQESQPQQEEHDNNGSENTDQRGEDPAKQEQDPAAKNSGNNPKQNDPNTPESSSPEDQQKDNASKNDRLQQQNQRFKEVEVSPEKAKMILDAVKSREKQYYQQFRRQPTKPLDQTKPDW